MPTESTPPPGTEPEKPSKPKGEWPSKIVPVLLSVVLTALITYVVTTYRGRLRTLPYYSISSSGIFPKPQLEGRQLQITIDGKPVENISTVSVAVFNTTDQDYDNVPLQVSFTNLTDPAKVLLAKVKVAPPLQPPQTEPALRGGNVVCEYTLPVVNRSDKPVFVGDYTFEGHTAPDVSVLVRVKGLETQHINGPPDTIISSILNLPLWVQIVIYAVFGLSLWANAMYIYAYFSGPVIVTSDGSSDLQAKGSSEAPP